MPQVLPAEHLPPWARREPPKPNKELAQALDYFDKRVTDAGSLNDTIAQALQDKDPRTLVRVAAVFFCSALDDLSRLIDALGSSEFRDERVAAITALRDWAGLRPDNDMKLYKALEGKYRAGPAEIIMTLLHTYGERDLADPLTYETLIAYLKHDKVAIRELAFYQLGSMPTTAPLVAQTPQLNFDPAGPAEQREAAYQKWKEVIPDGKLPPPPKAPMQPR
jgi:hypothetical protein